MFVADHAPFFDLQSMGVVGENNLMPKFNVIMLDSYVFFNLFDLRKSSCSKHAEETNKT